MFAISTNASEFDLKNDIYTLIQINNIKKISQNELTFSKLIGEGAQ